jgi:hypothetical protein
MLVAFRPTHSEEPALKGNSFDRFASTSAYTAAVGASYTRFRL